MARRNLVTRLILLGTILTVSTVLVIWGLVTRDTIHTIQDLLQKSEKLQEALTNLTKEDQIGYAKVVEQLRDEDGRLITTVRFVETSRDENAVPINEMEVDIIGDIVHFDAMVVRFDPKLIMDGKQRSIFIWRRIYGEAQAPADAYLIETPGETPSRYIGLLSALPLEEQRLFWTSIWDLAHNTEKLKTEGVRAIHGNVAYQQLRPDRTYIFRVSPSGDLIIDQRGPQN